MGKRLIWRRRHNTIPSEHCAEHASRVKMFHLYGGSIAEIATSREHTIALLYGGHPLPLGLQARCLFRKLGTSAWRGKRHARGGGHPATLALTPWIPAS